MSTSSHTTSGAVLRPASDHGEYDPELNCFYFRIENVGNRLSGYLDRDAFNWLAAKIGLPMLTDDLRSPE